MERVRVSSGRACSRRPCWAHHLGAHPTHSPPHQVCTTQAMDTGCLPRRMCAESCQVRSGHCLVRPLGWHRQCISPCLPLSGQAGPILHVMALQGPDNFSIRTIPFSRQHPASSFPLKCPQLPHRVLQASPPSVGRGGGCKQRANLRPGQAVLKRLRLGPLHPPPRPGCFPAPSLNQSAHSIALTLLWRLWKGCGPGAAGTLPSGLGWSWPGPSSRDPDFSGLGGRSHPLQSTSCPSSLCSSPGVLRGVQAPPGSDSYGLGLWLPQAS